MDIATVVYILDAKRQRSSFSCLWTPHKFMYKHALWSLFQISFTFVEHIKWLLSQFVHQTHPEFLSQLLEENMRGTYKTIEKFGGRGEQAVKFSGSDRFFASMIWIYICRNKACSLRENETLYFVYGDSIRYALLSPQHCILAAPHLLANDKEKVY